MRRLIASFGLVAVLASTTALGSGCYGSFALSHKIHAWNGQVSGEKFVNWLIFLGLVIIPVYPASLFVDAVVFNSIEFWGGQNPIAATIDTEPGAVYAEHEGTTYRVIPITDREFYVYRDTDYAGKAELTGDGSLVMLDADGRELRRLTADELAEARTHHEAASAPR